MAKRVMILALAMLFVIPAMSFAKDMTGKWGLGYFSNDAPVGARFWINEKVGIDVGVGFEGEDLGEETATSFWVDAGIPFVVFPSERANFFVRPGAQIGILDDRVYGSGTLDDTWTVITLSLTPGAEVFFGEHFSLEAGHGIAVEIASPPGDGDSSTSFSTFDASITHLGFHFYFK